MLEQIPAQAAGASGPSEELLAELAQAILKLPKHERAVIVADLEAGGTAPTRKLAEKLGACGSTIRTWRQRAHEDLRDILARHGFHSPFD